MVGVLTLQIYLLFGSEFVVSTLAASTNIACIFHVFIVLFSHQVLFTKQKELKCEEGQIK